ncbi:MAG: putative ferredoxin--NAD(+) reductase [Bryobacterales bacterium]|nr:putative ferredoxin--NAD(+) reductase [Bryobacterales bacterium]
MAPESIEFRPADFFDREQIEFISGDAAVEIERGSRLIRLQSGRELHYSELVLATGAHVRTLPGATDKVAYIRTLTDSLSLRSRMRKGGEMLAIGGGFIGLEAAAAARSMGMTVRLMAAEPRLMGRAVSHYISDWFAALHERHGVQFQLGTAVATLDDPALASPDIIVVGIGVIPNVALAQGAGLEAFSGIVTDNHLRTSDSAIFAVGDCALHPNAWAGGLVRLESVQNAADQARCVASTIAGTPKAYAHVPWFWTEQFEAKLQIAGMPGETDESVVRGDPAAGKFSVYNYQAGKLRFVESVNKPADHIAARKLLELPPSILGSS